MTRARSRTTWPYAMGFTAVGALLTLAACETPQPGPVALRGGETRSVADAAAPGKHEPVTLTIAPRGQYAINEQPVPVYQLAQRLQGIYTSRSGERVLHVKAREGVVGYDVVVASNAARQAGVRRISGVAEVAENGMLGAAVVKRRWEQILSPLDHDKKQENPSSTGFVKSNPALRCPADTNRQYIRQSAA